MTGALAIRLIIKGSRAVCADILQGGRLGKIQVNGEIIVSAGAIKTPQLLLLSGIGPGDQLRALDIPVHRDAPRVGQGLQNHVCYRPQYITKAALTASRHLSPWNAAKAGLTYVLRGSGPLMESYAPAGGFFRTDPGLETPDAQVVLLSALAPTSTTGSRFRMRDLLPKAHGFGLTIYQGTPNSRGAVSLRSRDPLAAPNIEPGYFTDPRDMQVLLSAVAHMREMMAQPAIAKHIDRELLPGPQVQGAAELEADIRRNGATASHQCGTCAMGGDDLSVLDPQLKVRGIDGLRVADASIMPRIPNAALHAPTIMIGEKAAAMIKLEKP